MGVASSGISFGSWGWARPAVVTRMALDDSAVSPWELTVTFALSVVSGSASDGTSTATTTLAPASAASGPTVAGAVVVHMLLTVTLKVSPVLPVLVTRSV